MHPLSISYSVSLIYSVISLQFSKTFSGDAVWMLLPDDAIMGQIVFVSSVCLPDTALFCLMQCVCVGMSSVCVSSTSVLYVCVFT